MVEAQRVAHEDGEEAEGVPEDESLPPPRECHARPTHIGVGGKLTFT